VLRVRGIQGELLVQAHSEEPDSLLRARRVLLDAAPGVIPYLVRDAQPLSQPSSAGVRVVLALSGIDSPERAEVWVGARVLLETQDLAPLPDGELYWRDLIGVRCVTRDGRELGVVREIWPTAGCDQLLVEGPGGRWFVPARDEVLLGLDRESRVLRIEPPVEG